MSNIQNYSHILNTISICNIKMIINTQNKKILNINILLHIFSFLTKDLINFNHCSDKLLISKFCNYINYKDVLYEFTNNNRLCSWIKCNLCKEIISSSPNFNDQNMLSLLKLDINLPENTNHDYCITCRSNNIVNSCKWCDLPFIAIESYIKVCNSMECQKEDKDYFREIRGDRWRDTN
jgi:hypothetical protein